MLTSITLTSTGSAVSTSTPKTGKLVRAFVGGGGGSVNVVLTAEAGNNLPSTEIYSNATANLTGDGVEIGVSGVVYFAEQTFTLTVAEAATAVLIIDTDG